LNRAAFRLIALSSALVLGVSGLSAQAPSQSRPRFTSKVELVSVDVNVVDGKGQPVTDLEAPDFTLSVDGQARHIVSAQFVPVKRAASAAGDQQDDYSTNTAAVAGRLIAVVVDRGSIAPVRAKDVLTAAARFVDGLEPADRVGFFTVPDGQTIEFTANHAAVASALRQVDGHAMESMSPRHVGVSEALEFERGNRMVIDEAMDRECGALGTATAGSTGFSEQAICRRLVEDDAAIVASQAHERARHTVMGLEALLARLASNDTPKTIVLVSEGLIIDGERLIASGLGRALATAHATIYAIKPETSDTDASRSRVPQTDMRDRTVRETGLTLVTHLAGGEMFRVTADPDASFERLDAELSGYYLLGFEPVAGDRDGKPHNIKVSTSRSSVQVRSRSQFTVDAATPANTEGGIMALLLSPAFATALPFAVTSYAFQDPDSPKIRLLIGVEVDAADARGDMALGLVVRRADGATAGSFFQPTVSSTQVNPETGKVTVFTSLLLDPGTYTMKAAIADASGQRGSLERPVRAFLTRIGRFRATQLMIGGNVPHGETPQTIVPTVSGAVHAPLHAYMEFFADAPGAFDGMTVRLEVVPDNGGPIVDSVPAILQPAGNDPLTRAAAGSIPLSFLPDGHYVARAIVTANGRKIGTMTRPFTLEALR
jgi:VWFA-related protein